MAMRISTRLIGGSLFAMAMATGSAAAAQAQTEVPAPANLDPGVVTPAADPTPAAPSASQEAAADDYSTDIIVTAQKREESINRVGLTITAIGADTLAERQIQSAADVAQAVPGLSYTNSANNTPVYTLRGVGFYDTSLGSYPTTSVYVDQVPLPFPILTSLTAYDLERIEVLKGPQGTLFGQNSTGGAINYIAAKPTADFRAGAELSYGRFDDFIGSAYVSGPIGSTLRARLAVRGEKSGPWQKSYTRNDENGRADQLAARFLLDWAPTDTISFELNINGWRDKSEPQAVQYLAFNQQAVSNTAPVLNYPRAPLNARSADWSQDNGMRIDRQFGQASLRGDIQFGGDLTLTSISSYIAFKERGALDQDGIDLQDIDLRDFYGRIRSFSQEVRIANGATNRFRFIVGGNYSRDTVYYRENLLYGDSSAFFNFGIDTSENYSDQKMRNLAAFGSAEFDVTDQLTLKGGVRYTDSRRSAGICNRDGGNGKTAALFTFFSRLLSGDPDRPALSNTDCFVLDANFFNGPVFQGQLNEDNVSWRGGVDFKPTDTLLFYANVSKGYKAGTFGNINASSTAQFNPAVQESILNYEAGFKAQFFDKKMSLTGAGFYMDYKNKQLRSKLIDGTFGILDAIVNIPKSHIQGGEIELQAWPVRGLSFGAALTYVDSKIDEYSGVNAGGVRADFAGTAVPFTPKWQGSTNARADIPLTEGLNLFTGAQLTYRSKTNAIVGETPLYDIDDYALLDLQVGIEDSNGRWKAMLWGKNVTNAYYWTNVVAGQDTVVRYAARPATYGVTVGFDF